MQWYTKYSNTKSVMKAPYVILDQLISTSTLSSMNYSESTDEDTDLLSLILE